ncbi:MAG: hypothetical protein AAF244_02805 [Pseudomonadota bacterium]
MNGEYIFSKIITESRKRVTDFGTEYFTFARQLIATPGKGNTFQITEIAAEKPYAYRPEEGEILKYSRLPVKLRDLWGQFVRGIPEKQTKSRIANFGIETPSPK